MSDGAAKIAGHEIEAIRRNLARLAGGDLYRRMIDEIQDYAIILLNKDGIILDWNAGAEKIKYYHETEIVGKHFSVFYFPEDLATRLPDKLLAEAAEQGRAMHEGWRKRKDGSRFWGSTAITALHGADESVIGFTKVTRDLTERKNSEDVLRISEQRHHQMIAEVQDYAIILLGLDGVIETWNAGAQKIKGYTSSEILGKRFDVFYTPEDRASGLPGTLLHEAELNGKANHEGWRVRKNGTRFWGTIVITALHDQLGNVVGFSKVTRDLTQRKESDDRLLSYTRQLEIQNSELEQFAFVASHDLQEPLRKIQTFGELIQNNLGDAEFVKRYFLKLDASAKRMSELVKSLLNYSRLAKESSVPEAVDLNEILSGVQSDLELMIEEKKAKITHTGLPVIFGDKTQLGQLFANLMSNSLKFSAGIVTIDITADVISGSEASATNPNAAKFYHRIIFKDNGIGFEQKYDKVIFSLFQRLHGKQDYAGTGIGLALCKKIIENHSGFISVTSELNQGARFTILLPLTPP